MQLCLKRQRDLIISIGYRINSKRGTQFCTWATSVLHDQPFVDGNKRIAADLFLWFLKKNRILYREDRTNRISENALVPMTLLIDEIHPTEKDVLVQEVAN